MAQKLALDIGKVRTGIAITDSLNIIASGLTTVQTENLLVELKDITREHNIDVIAVGKPTHLDGRTTDASAIVDEVCEKIKEEFPAINISMIDERFTSKLASKAILDSGAKKKTRRDKALVDKVSAVIILQTYLDLHQP